MRSIPWIGRTLATAGTAALLGVGIGLASAEDVTEVPVWWVGPTEGSVWRGAEFGAHDANIVGGFQGFKVEVVPVGTETLLDEGVGDAMAVVVGGDGADADRISEAFPGIAVFNVSSDDDALRSTCRRNLFSTMPSETMRSDALSQYRDKHGEADGIEALAHHPEFRRYSSSDLNGRFSSYHGEPMDEIAWTAFAAFKLIGDAYPRLGQVDPEGMIDYVREMRGFDASKGAQLTFRDNGQLRQPLWITAGDEIKGEAPFDTDDLDSLGPVECR